ncbi:L-asparaginase 1 [Polaribacter reichenbachii]|uniref:asparaginase n=1 Tax=Polaribacter reichenbachii TaxID=996801 RepID=A0A1B8TVW6_9FLAO|nr:asparaginase [Polaribacter reichenbachii]APZ45251.1 L-asparaginase 1 [Polaribacter reichenbachii]AUC19114.1 L-asparaginase 1 [Polaribacter reichenbachii]OBY63730.1 L-asparaginase 1 [Polaribacter reichenbachii]
MANKPNILIVYTGGTIGMIKDYNTNALKAFDFSQIVEKIPELQQLNCNIETISFDEPMDSSNMNTLYYREIAETIEDNYKKFDGFVILTGSDTMSYISSAISFMLENLQKPIIFTGSQLPIGDLRTDAKENLITSIEIACCQKNNKPIITEVCLYFEYKLYRANRTTKINAEQFEAFTSMNYPPLAESGVNLNFNQYYISKPSAKEKELVVRKELVNGIVILKLFPGITKKVVQSILNIDDLKGIIIETYGAGNAPNELWFLELLKKAISKNIRIVNVTQCSGGSVVQGHYETSLILKEIGVISGRDITTESAVAKLMYLLNENLSLKEFTTYFEKSIRGEISNE